MQQLTLEALRLVGCRLAMNPAVHQAFMTGQHQAYRSGQIKLGQVVQHQLGQTFYTSLLVSHSWLLARQFSVPSTNLPLDYGLCTTSPASSSCTIVHGSDTALVGMPTAGHLLIASALIDQHVSNHTDISTTIF